MIIQKISVFVLKWVAPRILMMKVSVFFIFEFEFFIRFITASSSSFFTIGIELLFENEVSDARPNSVQRYINVIDRFKCSFCDVHIDMERSKKTIKKLHHENVGDFEKGENQIGCYCCKKGK